MRPTATSLTSWAKTIKSAVEAAGVDAQALFREAGLDISLLNDPNARYPLEGTTRLWQLARAATGDEYLGLTVARHVTQTTFHALGYSLLASATLQDAFERLLRYFRIVTDAGDLVFEPAGLDYRFELLVDPAEPQPADEAIDAMLTVIIGMCRALYGRDFAPLRVSLHREAPADPAPFLAAMRGPVTFAAERNEILIAGGVVRQPLDGANAELARHNEEIITRYLAHFEKENVANRVHAVLVELLPNGEPSQERVADALHMSLRNLQRKLGAEDTSYKALLNDTRRDLALSYLQDRRYSISEIAYLLGFADTSSFTRAFRRWLGTSPKAYRAGLEAEL